VFHIPEFPPSCPSFKPVLCDGVDLGDNAPPGYPSLFSMPLINPVIHAAGIDIFGRPSRRESITMSLAGEVEIGGGLTVSGGLLTSSRAEGANAIAGLVGLEVWSGWPYSGPCQVVSVCNGEHRLAEGISGGQKLGAGESAEHKKMGEELRGVWKQKCGLDIGPVETVVSVRALQTMVQSPNGAVKRQYSMVMSTAPLCSQRNLLDRSCTLLR